MQNSAHFLCSLLLQWSLQNLILVLRRSLFGSSPSPWEPWVTVSRICILCQVSLQLKAFPSNFLCFLIFNLKTHFRSVKEIPFLCPGFLTIYCETGVMLYCAWSLFLELGQAHYKLNKKILCILFFKLYVLLSPFS